MNALGLNNKNIKSNMLLLLNLGLIILLKFSRVTLRGINNIQWRHLDNIVSQKYVDLVPAHVESSLRQTLVTQNVKISYHLAPAATASAIIRCAGVDAAAVMRSIASLAH